MKRILTLAAGGLFLFALLPLFLSGAGEFAMSLPIIGVCIAALAGFVLRLKNSK